MAPRVLPQIDLDGYLRAADDVVIPSDGAGIEHTPDIALASCAARSGATAHKPVHVGVDLGTAYTVLFVLDEAYHPLAGAYEFAQVIRDGVVMDFRGAVELVAGLKRRIERTLGFTLTRAATCHPPGVSPAEVKAARYVLESTGLDCSTIVDEPSAANAVLGIENGAVVDIGGGTTGIAIVRDGAVVYTADEPTGGTHLSLVISGALRIPFEDAERRKTDRREQQALFPMVRPVMEKMGSIILNHIRGRDVDVVYLVGGTCAFPGIDSVIASVTGVRTVLPERPLFVTPLGVALNDLGP